MRKKKSSQKTTTVQEEKTISPRTAKRRLMQTIAERYGYQLGRSLKMAERRDRTTLLNSQLRSIKKEIETHFNLFLSEGVPIPRERILELKGLAQKIAEEIKEKTADLRPTVSLYRRLINFLDNIIVTHLYPQATGKIITPIEPKPTTILAYQEHIKEKRRKARKARKAK